MDGIEWVRDEVGWVYGMFDKDVYQQVERDLLVERPISNGNSIAWVMYHLSRLHDVTVNTVIRGRAQVYSDGWPNRIGLHENRIGTGFGDEENAQFGKHIDVEALNGYWKTVSDQTMDWLGSAEDALLDQLTDVDTQAASVSDGAPGLDDGYTRYFRGKTVGYLLKWPVILHGYMHIGEMFTIKGALAPERNER